MAKTKLRKERDRCNDHQGSHARNGAKRRSSGNRKVKGEEDQLGTGTQGSSSALGESKSSSQIISVSQLAEELGLREKSESFAQCLTGLNPSTNPSDSVAMEREYTIGSESSRILKQYAQNPTKADTLTQLREKARCVVRDLKQLTTSYLELCCFIRTAMVRPEEVSTELCKCGFTKSRISEIKRISYASDEIFNDFKRRLTGWKATLERIRKNRDQEEASALQWNQLFRSFERQLLKAPPPQPIYQGSGQCLLMWNQEEFKTEPVRLVSLNGWKVKIERIDNGSADSSH